MATFSKLQVLDTICRTGMVPVFYHSDTDVACHVLKACYEGGVRVFEFTNRGDFALEVFTALMKFCRKECPEMILGVGSVIDAPTAALYLQNGANFVVGPYLNAEVARLCNRRLVPYTPGCGSATEIGEAHELGCDLVKMTAWMKAGTTCVGMGSKLFPKDRIAAGDWNYITEKCRYALDIIRRARQ